MKLRPAGFLYALLAYASWGVFPLYWKAMGRISPLEIVSHRVIWSFVLLAGLAAGLGHGREVRAVLRHPRHLVLLALTAFLLSANWGLFIYGVLSGQVVQTSLGYFLTPLVTILLGCVFLKERLTLPQIAAVVMAACGVIHFGWHLGRLPWLPLSLALSFGFYGLLRKIVPVGPLVGVLIETTLMAPAALGTITVLSLRGQAAFPHTAPLFFLGAGLVTTLPLIWFNSAAKLLPLSTMGFLQYVSPTLMLLVGVLLFHEPFTSREGVSFLFIWLAIALYLHSLFRSRGPALPVLNTD